MIRVRNFTVVQVIAIFGAERFRRIIWAVRIIQMQPQKKWALRRLLQDRSEPSNGMRHTVAGSAVHKANIFFLKGLGCEGVVVKIETAGQTPRSIKHISAHHRPSRIAILLEGLRDRSKLGVQRCPGKVLHAVLKGISSSQNYCVRWPGQRYLRNRAFEYDSVAPQRIQRWGLNILCAIAANMVRAHRINGNQDDIRPSFRSVGNRRGQHVQGLHNGKDQQQSKKSKKSMRKHYCFCCARRISSSAC